MKLPTGLHSLAVSYSAFAELIPRQNRALADYQGVLCDIKNQVATVSDSVASYVDGSIPGTDVRDASKALVNVINDGATSISGFDNLSSTDALALVSLIQTLTGDVRKLVDAVIAAKANLDVDGFSADIRSYLQVQKIGSEALRDAITPKVPAAFQDTAADLAEDIVTEIDRGIAAYSG
ncbi:hydrophobic surface binding protein A-domain-containing protein [Aspergillus varians]